MHIQNSALLCLMLPVKGRLEWLEKDQRDRTELFGEQNITENKWKLMANCQTVIPEKSKLQLIKSRKILLNKTSQELLPLTYR